MKRFTFTATLFAVTLAAFLIVASTASAADIARRPGRGYLPPPPVHHHHGPHFGPHHMPPVGPPLHIHHRPHHPPHHWHPIGPPPVVRPYRPSYHRPCRHDYYLMKRPIVEVYF